MEGARSKSRGGHGAADTTPAARDSSAETSAPSRTPAFALAQGPEPAVSLFGGGLVQTKLAVGSAGDPYEREADSVAAHVASDRQDAPAPAISALAPNSLVQTKQAGGEDEASETSDEPETPAQMTRAGGANEEEEKEEEGTEQGAREEETPAQRVTEDDEPAEQVQTKRAGPEREKKKEEEEEDRRRAEGVVRNGSGGEPLKAETRNRLEGRMGQDFSDVRVHTGAQADGAARSLGARAFTNRNHVWLASGERPDDVRLMAHELTHVVQQGGVGRRPPRNQPPPGDAPAPDAAKNTTAATGPTSQPQTNLPPAATTNGDKAATTNAAAPTATATPNATPTTNAAPAAKVGTPTAAPAVPASQPLAPAAPNLSPSSSADAAKSQPGAPALDAAVAQPLSSTPSAPGATPTTSALGGVVAGEAGAVAGADGKAATAEPGKADEAGAGAAGAAGAQGAGAEGDASATAGAAVAGAAVAGMTAPETASGGAGAGGGAGVGLDAGSAGVGAAPSVEAAGGEEAGGGGEDEGAAEMEERMAAAAGEEKAIGGGGELTAEDEVETPEPEDEAAGAALTPLETAPASSAVNAAATSPAASGGAAGDVDISAMPGGGEVAEVEKAGDEMAAEERAAEDDAEQTPSDASAGEQLEVSGGGGGVGVEEPEADAAGGAAGEGEAEASGGEAEKAEQSGELTAAERDAAMSSLGEGGGGGGGSAGGGGGGGGAIPEKTEPEPPDVSGMEPPAAMAALSGLPPAKLAAGLGGVNSSISRTVGDERGELASKPPELERPSGSPVTKQGPTGTPPAPSEQEAAPSTEEAPGGAPQPVPEPEPLPTPPAPPTQSIAPPQITGGGEKGELSEEDIDRMESSIGALPTSDPALEVDAGEPPPLELAGDADPAQAEEQRANLEKSVAEAHEQGSRDAAQPLGEAEIYPTVPRETLKANVPSGGAAAGGAAGAGGGAAAAGGGLGAGDAEEAASIIAAEKSGGEIQAAVGQAQGDMAAERVRHDQKVSEERGKAQEEIARVESENSAAQEAERGKAQGEVQQARADWSAEQQEAVDKSRVDADAEAQKGQEEIVEHQAEGEEQAAAAIEEGNEEAAEAKAEGEQQAEAEKAKGEEESSGFFGWLSSKATSFFNSIKEGIKKAFDAARRAVKAAIEKAKQLAVAAIEAARKAIVDVIRRVGDALIAIGDVLLAAFPGLRDKWRKYIKEKVSAAEAAVNKLAEDLKAGVQKLLDMLGAALDAALGLLEKGLLAAVDAANAVVQGAIKAAKAVAEALGAFLVLIKDVASGPGQWLSNLGSSASDGVRNHLWGAFQSAVKQWFNQKLEEVLGIGPAVFGVLAKGGVKMEEVGKTAFEAVKGAIPEILIGLIIEKVVSMIIPAAGAVLVIIEGLQAAWGTVSRIISAFSLFMAFLKQVKTGNAGPQFAAAVAAAAVVVIDFVANWLLKRLRKPASKVAGKLKAMAQRMMKKIKKAGKKAGGAVKKAVKKGARALKRGAAKLKSKFKPRRKKKAGGAPGKSKKKTKQQKAQERLDKAVAAIKPQVERMLARGTSVVILKAKLVYWRVRYRLSALTLGPGGQIVARVNPSVTLASGRVVSEAELGRLLQPIFKAAEEEYERELMQNPEARKQYDEAAGKFERGEENALEGVPRDLQQKVLRDKAKEARERAPQQGEGGAEKGDDKKPAVQVEPGVSLGVDPGGNLAQYEVKMGSVGSYPDMLKHLREKAKAYGLSDKEIESVLAGRPDAIGGKLGELSTRIEDKMKTDREGALKAKGKANEKQLAKPLPKKKLKERDSFLNTLRRASFLTQTVEPARHGGIATTSIVASALVNPDKDGTMLRGKALGLEDVLSREGQFAPMTPVGVLGSTEGKSKSEQEDIEKAKFNRDLRIGHVFGTLLNQAKQLKLVTSEAGGDLSPLAAAIHNWLEQRFDARQSPRELKARLGVLVAEVKALLARYNGR